MLPAPDVVTANRQFWDRCLYVTVMLAGIVGVVVLYLWDPTGNAFFPKCIFFSATGLYCPGCGTQRALHHLLHARIATAFHHNAFALLALPMLAAGLWRWTLATWWAREPWGRTPRAKWIWTLFVLVMAFWLLRNIPVYPLTLLAPPAGIQ